jgi:catechol 2,3-dioxygenase-like lactoylglutathione lyase family enzyme
MTLVPPSTPTGPRPAAVQHLSLTGVERWSFIAYDLEATHRFYTDVLLRPLVYAQTNEYLPGSDERAPHIEVRYGLDDGSTINFICFEGEPPDAARRLHPLRHFAFEVKELEQLHAWKEHLLSKGLEVLGEIDHEVVMSIYFHDPNEIRLELCTSLIEFDPEEERKAREVYDQWMRLGSTEQRTAVQSHKLERR